MWATVYKGLSVIAIAPVFNEESKIVQVINRVPRDVVDETLVVDDGSTDGSAELSRRNGATVLSLGQTIGVGAALREAYDYAVKNGFDVAVVMAGNNKDSPEEIPLLVEPIADGTADFVQGSRFLSSGRNFGEMPAYRKVATRIHPLLFSIVARRKVTESTNGFRAVSTKVLKDPRLNLHQDWLKEYELEPYLYLKVIKLGYRTAEVPVTKVYPPKELGQTKMKPISGWWSILRPIVFIGLGIKR